MPAKKSSKKRRNKEKKEQKAAAALQKKTTAISNDEPSFGEYALAQMLKENPEKVQEYLDTMQSGGISQDEAMAQLMASLNFRDKQDQSALASAFDDKEKRCNREGCENKGEFLCIGCNCHYYCGIDCQRIAWRTLGHKQECKLLKKCSELGSMPQIVAMGDSVKLGIVRTKNHGNFCYAMERYQHYTGDEQDRLVPLANVAFEGDTPTFAQVTTCLTNAILHPEFDTMGAGARRPCNVVIQSKTFGNEHVAEHVAAICHRLGILVTSMGNDDDDENGEDDNKSEEAPHKMNLESCWLCVQKGWSDEIPSDSSFLERVNAFRRHPVPVNGSVRKELLPKIEALNKIAEESASTPPNLAKLRKQVMRLPYEQDQPGVRATTAVAVHEGVLFVVKLPSMVLLHHERVVLDTTTFRPSFEVALGALYRGILQQKCRPSMIHLGQPSICSHQDVELFENALDGSVLQGQCTLGSHSNIEAAVESAIPRWRLAGVAMLAD